MSGEWRVGIFEDGEAANFADIIWNSMPEKVKRACFFDVPFEIRDAHLATALAKAKVAAIITDYDNQIIACGYAISLCENSETAACHVIIRPSKSIVHNVTNVSSLIKGAFIYFKTLICLIPANFYGLRNILEVCGFSQAARLPKAAHLALYKRNVDAMLYTITRSGA